jgi:N4-gp56 family major capsid protein
LTEITASDVDEVTQTLLGADARYFLDKIPGENRFGTAPVRNGFFALASTDVTSSLNNVAGFIHSSQYPNPNGPLPQEWGVIGNLRFLVSSRGSMTPTSSNLGADVYNIFCMGMEALGCVEQDGYSAQFIYNGPELNGPMRLNSTAAYKFAEVPRILNDAWVINLRCTI